VTERAHRENDGESWASAPWGERHPAILPSMNLYEVPSGKMPGMNSTRLRVQIVDFGGSIVAGV
jgi:hypothetical protein